MYAAAQMPVVHNAGAGYNAMLLEYDLAHFWPGILLKLKLILIHPCMLNSGCNSRTTLSSKAY